jgi:hypothetical protein
MILACLASEFAPADLASKGHRAEEWREWNLHLMLLTDDYFFFLLGSLSRSNVLSNLARRRPRRPLRH